MAWSVEHGNCLKLLAAMPEASVDAIVTDPPYGLGFMGRAWDDLPPGRQWAEACLRVLKPGGYLLAFGGTRTYHRLTAAIEDAGFEIRDEVLSIVASIDAGAQFLASLTPEQLGALERLADGHGLGPLAWLYGSGFPKHKSHLKPAHEPIVLAWKTDKRATPLNIDSCRTPISTADRAEWSRSGGWMRDGYQPSQGAATMGPDVKIAPSPDAGRWPANVVLDGEAAAQLDEQSGELVSGANPTRRASDKFRDVYGEWAGQEECEPARGLDRGGASRFFYCAKASSAERNAGLDGLPASAEKRTTTPTSTVHNGRSGSQRVDEREYVPVPRANTHPTVKPIDLMRWLVRLVTPPQGMVLDPFAGSGTTGIAAVLEGFDFIGHERESEYVAIARARIAHWEPQGWQGDLLGGEAAA